MIRVESTELRPGSDYRFHRAVITFICDDEGWEHFQRYARDHFGADIKPIPPVNPELPGEPIEGELIDD